jgi:3-hydroxyisobutyrate dehydrogenase-like beta-hydroxyacid dehydrogenase
MAEAAAGWGAPFLDGAIMSYPSGIGTAESTILYSGDEASFEVTEGLRAALAGESSFLGPDPGLAAIYDLGLLTLFYSATVGFLHGVALARSEGVSADSFARLAGPWLSGIAEGVLGDMARQVDARKYPGTEATLAVHTAAMKHALAGSRDGRLRTDIVDSLIAVAETGNREGRGSDDLASLVEVLAPTD